MIWLSCSIWILYIYLPFNPQEWLACISPCSIALTCHENKGNYHQFNKLFNVKQILVSSTIGNVLGRVWGKYILMLGCTGFNQAMFWWCLFVCLLFVLHRSILYCFSLTFSFCFATIFRNVLMWIFCTIRLFANYAIMENWGHWDIKISITRALFEIKTKRSVRFSLSWVPCKLCFDDVCLFSFPSFFIDSYAVFL